MDDCLAVFDPRDIANPAAVTSKGTVMLVARKALATTLATLAASAVVASVAPHASATSTIATGTGCRAAYNDALGYTLRPCIGYDSYNNIAMAYSTGGGDQFTWFGGPGAATLVLTLYKQNSSGGWNQVNQVTESYTAFPGTRVYNSTFYHYSTGWGRYYIAESYVKNGVSHDNIQSPVMTLAPCC
ncbi:hypothetical protein ACIBHX_27780 [Nonomuraea sp. NPDC050536]|uniref:hypothetical protein n=1 Tax=Nonomuraea sp. NPDC050536 TaxID=3364366 RepID=UPI0037C64773